MADIIPFKGIYYNCGKVPCGDVTAPPYDIITSAMRAALYARNPYNIVRIDAGAEQEGDGPEENKYRRAEAYLRDWLKEGVLKRSEKPAFYVYRMEYEHMGEMKALTGFFGAVRIVELGKGVYPHEATHSKPKSDRMALMQTMGLNTSPIFSLYDNGPGVADILKRVVSGGDTYLKSVDQDGNKHSMWMIEDGESIEQVRSGLSRANIFIADGHHRYETAFEYRNMMRERTPGGKGEEPHEFVLMFLADMKDQGLTALPTHRMVRGDVKGGLAALSDSFEVVELPRDADIIYNIKGLEHSIGLYTGGRLYVLKHKGREGLEDLHPSLGILDVVALEELILKRLIHPEDVSYEMDPGEVIRKVDAGEFDAGFFLNPTAVEEVRDVALSSERMPPKSTYFYPKVQTGFVMYELK